MGKKKSLAVLMVFVIICTLTFTGCSQPVDSTENDAEQNVTLVYDEFIITTWDVKTNTAIDCGGNQISGSYAGKDMLLHNNGNAIETNEYADGNNQGNYLVAVYVTEKNGGEMIMKFHTNDPTGKRADLINDVTESVKKQK
ncbi:MAG: hypothetical protein IJN72_10335 [Firmicutes bacterium]|nr:hypothetical protein [Bacillota bacterium]